MISRDMEDMVIRYQKLKEKELEILNQMHEDYEKMVSNLYKIICEYYKQKDQPSKLNQP